MAERKGEQGTGKHPHKSAEEPHPHNEAPTTKGESGGSKSSGSHSSSGEKSKENESSESSDLKSREYKDEKGNIHHHTHTAGSGKK